jgi:hypothetical protein
MFLFNRNHITRKNFLSSIILSAVFLLLFSCKKEEATVYYPIDSLMEAQINYLAEHRALLTKKAEIDGKEDTSSFTPKDTTSWASELDIFTELNVINKPITMGSYTVERGINDTQSNLSILSFSTTEDLPIVYLKVYYLEKESNLRRIEALYHEENSLLKGSRLLIMEFQEINDAIVLTSYSIEGGQKIFLGDSVKFSIQGTVTLL